MVMPCIGGGCRERNTVGVNSKRRGGAIYIHLIDACQRCRPNPRWRKLYVAMIGPRDRVIDRYQCGVGCRARSGLYDNLTFYICAYNRYGRAGSGARSSSIGRCGRAYKMAADPILRDIATDQLVVKSFVTSKRLGASSYFPCCRS